MYTGAQKNFGDLIPYLTYGRGKRLYLMNKTGVRRKMFITRANAAY
jgi:hypothetical protein